MSKYKTCIKGRVAPSATTKMRLFADSGGYCQNPECLAELFKDIGDEMIHIAEMAHVISAADDGPRANKNLTPEERAEYGNLILLCPTCHTIIDKAEKKYPDALVGNWKSTHKSKIQLIFGIEKFEFRNEVRKVVVPLFRENHKIFEKYGPMTEERFNPESSMPTKWRAKIRTRIIPNNRKILAACDVNSHLLNAEEKDVVEDFRQHVLDFEAKHVDGQETIGVQFPKKMDTVFLD